MANKPLIDCDPAKVRAQYLDVSMIGAARNPGSPGVLHLQPGELLDYVLQISPMPAAGDGLILVVYAIK